MWDEIGGEEETERVIVMKRKWEREGAREGKTEKYWRNEEIGRGAMVDTRKELLLHKESEWSDK